MSNHHSPIVLMYHGTPENRPRSKYSIKSTLFHKHIRFLKKNNWHTALFRDIKDLTLLPPRTVILTFDDGYKDNYQGAFLPLCELNMKATWFVTTQSIGKNANWIAHSPQNKMLDEEQILEMHRNGMEIGSHTCSHRDLQTLGFFEQREEFVDSKAFLENLLQSAVTSLAYPFGRYNSDSLTAARDAGYHLACTTQPGWLHHSQNPLLIRRITMFSGDSEGVLARKLALADNDVSFAKMARYYSLRLLDKLS